MPIGIGKLLILLELACWMIAGIRLGGSFVVDISETVLPSAAIRAIYPALSDVE